MTPSSEAQDLHDDHSRLSLILGRVEGRMDDHDRRFDTQDRILLEIRDEVRRTNGRVTTIEKDRTAETAVLAERADVISAAKEKKETGLHRREWLLGFVIACVSVAASILLPVVIPH